MTSYATKNQKIIFNYLALVKGYTYHITHPSSQDVEGTQGDNKLLLYRLMNAISFQQEIAAPLAVSYLMGYGDVYRSHSYTAIYWSAFARELKAIFVYLQYSHASGASVGSQVDIQDGCAESVSFSFPFYSWVLIYHLTKENGQEKNEMTYVGISSSGHLHTQSQVQDYALRGDALEEFTILSFFTDTYEEDQGKDIENCSVRGRYKNPRIPYRSSHWKAGKKTRVLRSDGHQNLPNMIGQWFPCRDIAENSQYYCASMLMLLKPWRNLRTDLKIENETWEYAFEQFVARHAQKEHIMFMLSNIQFFHECDSAAQHARDQMSHPDAIYHEEEKGEEDGLETGEGDEATECIIRSIQETQTPWPERQYAQIAIDLATLCGVFRPGEYEWHIGNNTIRMANDDDQAKLKQWKEEMRLKIQGNEGEMGQTSSLFHHMQGVLPTIQPINEQDLLRDSTWDKISTGENCLTAVDPSELNEDQVFLTYND